MDIQLTVHVPDLLLPQAENLKKTINQLAIEAVEEALQREEQVTKSEEPSKWAKLVQETAHIDLSDESYQHVQNTTELFRNEFAFNHDLVVEKE